MSHVYPALLETGNANVNSEISTLQSGYPLIVGKRH